MKKINLSSKAKRSIIITGSALVCVAVAAIALHMGGVTAAAEPQSIASSSLSTSAVVSVAPITGDSEIESQASSTFTPSSGASKSTELTKIEKPTSAPPAPIVKGDASTTSNGKVTPPTNPALTDKSKKPSYSSKPTATSQPTKSPSKPANNTPSGGKPGQVYDPVFGWQYPTGGEGTTVGNPGDELTGNKVGIMD